MRSWREYAVWWVLLYACYLGLITTRAGWELLAGAALAALAAGTAVLGRRAFSPATGLPRFTRRLVLLPVDLVTDAASLTRLLVTGRARNVSCGETDEIALPDGAPATQAWAVLVLSASPGSLVVDVDTRRGRPGLLVHRLTRPGRASAELKP